MPSGEPVIETRTRRGVCFVAAVSQLERAREREPSIDEVLATHKAWIEGRAALETLECEAIARARTAFHGVVARVPGQASAHVGLANACALQFEMTRTDAEPDVAALKIALTYATEACRLQPKYGEAWATLGFVLERVGRRDDALAAARQSLVLEPDNWRHHLRLSAASWGEERIREARLALNVMPGLAMAHWLVASVLVARQAFWEAEHELVTGLAGCRGDARARFSGIALHWLLGLIASAGGDSARGLDEFDRELQQEDSGHLYANEVAANTWYAIGAARFRSGDRDGAQEALFECVRRVPRHMYARAALGEAPPTSGPPAVDRAISQAIYLYVGGDRTEYRPAVSTIECALGEAPAGNAGWLLSVEPMLDVACRSGDWLAVMNWLRTRAA